MLSAGQRNALLLAPLLAVTSGGPFGFLVLDDPVHAFDQVRVDRLASVIHELARDRRVIVLTHDERLTEHLVARGPHCDTMTIERDAASSKVSVDVQREPWQVMLDDARGVLQVSARQPDGVTVSPTDLVRGLCRQAVDTALRQFVLRAAVRRQRDPSSELEQLDGVSTTKERLKEAKRFYPPDSAAHACVANAETRVLPHLPSWNQAAHGNPPETPAAQDDIRAAEEACVVLAGDA